MLCRLTVVDSVRKSVINGTHHTATTTSEHCMPMIIAYAVSTNLFLGNNK